MKNLLLGSAPITKDIFVVTDEMPDGEVVKKFYDSDKSLIAWSDKDGNLFIQNDGRIYPLEDFAKDDLSFLGQFRSLSQENGYSLTEYDEHLEKVAKVLGLSREDIKSMSEVDLKDKVGDKADPQIDLDDKNKDTEHTASNKNALDSVNSKQEIDLNIKVDDRYTLGDILGISSGAKLIAVYSDSIANNKNTTRFSFIIQNSDGSLEPADMLEQVGGKDSDKSIYETNRDGSEVEKQSVNSSYAIDSPIVKNGIITARIGSMGYIEVGYGQMDRTSHRDAFTQELETEHTRYTTREVREEFSSENGIDNVPDNLEEAKSHDRHGRSHNLSLADADGKTNTTTVEHLLSPDVVDSNVQAIINEFPSSNYVRNNALQIYLSVVREHGNGNSICYLSEIMDEVSLRLEMHIGDDEHESDDSRNEYEEEEDYIPTHRH